MCCWMKLTTEIGIEAAMLVSTAYENWNVFMIMDFSALVVINYLDLYYNMTIKDDLKDKIENVENKMPVENHEVNKEKMILYEWCSYYFLIFINLFYEIVYFHFVPYIGLYFSIVVVKHY